MIRRATAADAGRLTELVRGSGAYRGGYAAMVEDYEVTADYIAAHDVFVAERDGGGDGGGPGGGALLGFYALILGPPAELDLMFVADEAQGLGVGRRLAAHMKDRARAAGLSGVRVVSHPPSEGFYRSVGAERTGTVPAKGPVTWERPELVFALG
ncbi:GNAT family N-acetyltransferase [Streptomyces roseifaciens]|uniref:GNAT family N-acetyltransferase n=1 Tax=Streptomyces roseifaciens TaxID=1488406 RepID=UPI000A8414AA|nr:GNAT family N-acetyltransferase [Streptomyces roseifaciens]